jgi:hypothetical protein
LTLSSGVDFGLLDSDDGGDGTMFFGKSVRTLSRLFVLLKPAARCEFRDMAFADAIR